MIKTIIIGAGNIIKTRHLPVLKKNPERFSVQGIIDVNADKARDLAHQYAVPHHTGYVRGEALPDLAWIRESQAVIIATSPDQHEPMVRRCLELGKHVLVEKPFVTNVLQGKSLIELSHKKRLMLAVNHNFQFSHAFLRLHALVQQGKLGDVRSMYCVQITNDQRRLPAWADTLPLGLFYDETPHVFYLMKAFGGNLSVQSVHAVTSAVKKNTPKTISVDLTAGTVPSSIYINFESPVCEWVFTVFGSKSMAMVDMFRDILTVLPNDGQHLMKEVFTTSALATWQHWKGFVFNGIQYINHNLFYGIDHVHRKFYEAVSHDDRSFLRGISAEEGLAVNQAQWDVIGKSARE